VDERIVRESGTDYDVAVAIQDLEREMLEAAEALEFERAAMLRDQIAEIRGLSGLKSTKGGGAKRAAGGKSASGKAAAEKAKPDATGKRGGPGLRYPQAAPARRAARRASS
jgi:excinuclease ABC subunit B